MEEEAEILANGRKERRARPRFAVDEGASLLILNHGSSFPARVVELSMGGCRLRVAREVRATAGVRVELTFKVNGIAFRLAGVQQWTDGKGSVGIRFSEMPERRRAELGELLAEIEAEAAAKAAKAAEEESAVAPESEWPVAEELLSENLASERQEQKRAAQEKRNQEKLNWEQAEREKLMREQASAALRKEQLEARRKTAEQAAASGSRLNPAKISSLRLVASGDSLVASPAVEGEKSAPIAQRSEDAGAAARVKTPSRERRAQTRHSVDSQATIYLVDVAARTAGRIVDVSMGGCRIRTDERFPVGIYRRVEAEFVLDGLPFRLGGVTQSLHDRHTVGIRFLDLSERKREQLMMLVEEIDEMHTDEKSREPAPGPMKV